MTRRPNSLSQELNVGGSCVQDQDKNKANEPLFLGDAISGQTGAAATITAFSSNQLTVDGLTGITSDALGRFLTLSNSDANDGTFRILEVLSASSVVVESTSGSFPDANSGSISWAEREPYSLEDDINFIRTDRADIKGVDFWRNVPTYRRPDDNLTDVDTNLANIAGNTLDAKAWIESRYFERASVSTGNSLITITDAGNLKHADSVDFLGVPVFDGYDSGNARACFVEIVDANLDGYGDGSNLRVLSGAREGERVIGLTQEGSSTSTNSVEIAFYSVSIDDWSLSALTPYVWESDQTKIVNLCYGYRQRLDLLSETALREALIKGALSDVNGTGGGGGSGGGITEGQHEALRQLIHFIDDGPTQGFSSGAFKENVGLPFCTSETWYTDSGKSGKIVELLITRDSTQKPVTEVWNIYDTDGSTILASVTDTINYSGPFETDRTRAIS